MTSSVTALVLGQSHLQDDILVHVSGAVDHPTRSDTADVVIADPDGHDVRIEVTVGSRAPDTTDVMILVCAANDTSSLRFLADSLTKIFELAPFWLPVTTFVLHRAERPEPLSPSFLASLHELEGRLDRLAGYSPAQQVTIADNVTSGAKATVVSLPDALLSCVDLVRSPLHVLWDRRSEAWTLTGERALRRAFWTLDNDADGLLSDAEILLWFNKMFDRATDEDVATVKANLRDADDKARASSESRGEAVLFDEAGVTLAGFMSVCESLVREARGAPVWAMLWETGINHAGLPYSHEALERVPLPSAKQSVQLSQNGVRFFAAVFNRRATGPVAGEADVRGDALWDFTPDCPWRNMHGMPAIESGDFSVDDFVTCWRTMAALNPTVVAEFAYYWGYASDAALLFVVKPARGDRTTDRDWPTTLRVMVLGSPGCGKSSLLKHVVGAASRNGGFGGDESTVGGNGAKGPVVRPLNVARQGEIITLILEELDETDAKHDIADPSIMAMYDGVLMCFSPSDDVSMDYMYECVPDIAAYSSLPVVFVLTKADMPFSDAARDPAPNVLLARHGFAWCPLAVSVRDDRANQLGISNDLEALPNVLLDAMHCVEATKIVQVSTARKIRRIAVVAAAIGITGLVLKRLFSKLRR